MRNLRPTLVALNVALGASLLAACDFDADTLIGKRKNINGPESSLSPEALACTDKPQGHSYVLFDGSKLEDTRVNEGDDINRARFKPYAVMAGEYQRVLGVVPKSLASAGPTFDAPPERWYSEPSHSGVSVSSAFDVSFEACEAHVASSSDFAALPTADTANRYCGSTMRKAWSRTPSPEVLDDCVELATKKLDAEPDPRRRWSYVCAAILSSSNFLTY